MGNGDPSTTDYTAAVNALHATRSLFARSAAASATGNYRNIADILNPRLLKNGMRESCFAPGFNDVLPCVISIDATGSMDKVPWVVQEQLPKLIELLIEQGITDHPNVMFMCHDDEYACPPDAVFQMSQFEIGAAQLVESLNEMIIPHLGGGNDGEAYHLSFYAVAHHTRMESFERDGSKGFFFMICDEQPFYEAQDPATHGTSVEIAKEVFGDVLEGQVTMRESVRKTAERYHVFIIRPGHTLHGKDRGITRLWQKLLGAAGVNPEHVLEVEETDAIISTMALCIGRLNGADQQDLVDVLKSKGAAGIVSATAATQGIVPVGKSSSAVAKLPGTLATTDGLQKGRRRL